MLSRKKRSCQDLRFSGFPSSSGTLVRFSTKIDVLPLTFTKPFRLVMLRPAEASLSYGYIETTLSKELLFLAFAYMLQKSS